MRRASGLFAAPAGGLRGADSPFPCGQNDVQKCGAWSAAEETVPAGDRAVDHTPVSCTWSVGDDVVVLGFTEPRVGCRTHRGGRRLRGYGDFAVQHSACRQFEWIHRPISVDTPVRLDSYVERLPVVPR